jgi:hypothetical protein
MDQQHAGVVPATCERARTMTSSGVSGDSAVPCIPLNVQFRRKSGRYLAVGYQHTLELSETAAFICKQIDGRLSVVAIAEIVKDEYAIDETTALSDVQGLLDDLSAFGLISWKD